MFSYIYRIKYILMKLILVLEIFCVLLKNTMSMNCPLPHGLHISEMGIVYTLSCPVFQLSVQFEKELKRFSTNRKFSRIICNDDSTMIVLSPKSDEIFFCTDKKCSLSKSIILSLNLSRHLNGSIFSTPDLSHIYYCVDSKWYSLLQTDLPQELKLVNYDITTKPLTTAQPHKTWPFIYRTTKLESTVDEKVYMDNSLSSSYIYNSEDLKYLRINKKPESVDLCGIAIIFTAIFSFFFFITIVLIISSKYIQNTQIRRQFIKPNTIIVDLKQPPEYQFNINNSRKEISHTTIETSESGIGSRGTGYTLPSNPLVQNNCP